MEQNAQRELRSISPEWTVGELMARIARALASDGPALLFGASQISTVSPRISIVVQTTGSSGAAKEVGLSANALLSSARASHEFLGAQFGNTWSLLLPLTHIAGINVLVRSLELGTEAIDLREHNGEYPVADFTAVVPTQIFRALNSDPYLLNHLQSAKAVLVGGAALSADLHKQATDAGIKIVTTYGMTETSGGCVYNGVPLKGVEVSITSDHKVAIRGSILATTYVNAEQDWNAQLRDGWFITRDTGHFDHEKLIVDGRIDDVIISGGENISLHAVEESLSLQFPHKHFAAFAIDDSQWGQALHLAVAGDQLPLQSEIDTFLSQKFGAVGKPKGYLYLSELPLIGIGKIDRKKLQELYVEAHH